MSERFPTPQDAEDAFYDAIDEQNLDAMMAVWEDSDDVACLLPMTPFVRGRGVRAAWDPLLNGAHPVEIQVTHLYWVEGAQLALHYVEERVSSAGQPPQSPPMYATNVYRLGPDGWRMILHQNAPYPPPADRAAAGRGGPQPG